MTHSIEAQLLQIVERLSGYGRDELDCQSTFLELGFDSLFLTQLSTALRGEFELEITFRQLFAEVPSIAELATHIEPRLDPERRRRLTGGTAAQATEPPSESLPEETQATAPAARDPAPGIGAGRLTPALRGLIEEQLALMSRQLELVSAAANPALRPVAAEPLIAAEPPIAAEQPVSPASEAVPAANQLPEGFGPRPEAPGARPEMTEAQRRHLEQLLTAYLARTGGSRRSTQAYRQWHADPRTASGFNRLWKEIVYPLVVTRSKGSRLWDVDGNEYIDLLNGFGPNFLGHSPDFIVRALVEQLENGVEIGPQTPLAGETAKLICEFSGMDRATFVNTGSEAVQAAIRVARTVTGRDRIVVFSGDYHGNFDEVLVRAANRRGRLQTMPLAPGIPHASVSNVTVLDYGSDQALSTIQELAGQLAAVLVEPIQSRQPELQPREFLHRLRDITREHDVLLVFDEVITGFRSQPGGAQAFYGVQADLATYGKVLGGGMPIGVVAGRQRFMDTFDGGQWQYGDDSFPEAGVTFFAGTFIRHPLTITATHATLNYLKQQGAAIHERINARAKRLCTALNDLFQRHRIAIEVPHANSQIFVRVAERHPLAMLLFFHLRLRGVYIQEGFPCYLTDAHSDADLEAIVRAFEQTVEAMVGVGIFGSPARAPELAPADLEQPFPLTDSQFEICFESQLRPEANCAYKESDTLVLKGALAEDILCRALQDTVARHDAFRLRFRDDTQFFAESAGLEIQRIDLRPQPPAERDAARRRVMDELVSQPFDLLEGPLCAARLVVIDDQLHHLTFSAHHAVYDGWSAQLLLEELAERYCAQLANRAPELTAPGSYREFATRTVAVRDSEPGERSRRHWRQRLAELPPALQLPLDGHRPGDWDYRGDTVGRQFEEALSVKLRALAGASGATMFAVTLAAFKLLLWRISGQRHFTVGVSLASQPVLDMPEVIGHGVNFIPVPITIDPRVSASQLIRDTMADVLDLSEYPHCSIGTLVRSLDVPRDPSRPLLAQVTFNYAPKNARLKFTGLDTALRENARRHVHAELFANLMDTGQGLHADWDYATTLFDRQSIEQWLGCFEAILGAMAAGPQRPVGELDWIPAAEQTRIEAWSAGPRLDLHGERVEQLFEKVARATPDRPAVADADQQWTYRDLDARANGVAARLAEVNADGEPVVGILSRRRVEMVAAVLGAFKAGWAYLPLDANLPDARIRFMVEDGGCQVILCDAQSAAQARPLGVPLIELEQVPSAPRPAAQAKGAGPAYLIYTSGSTGKPKGVLVGHRQVINLLTSMAQRPGLHRQDRLLALTTLSFDISVLELLGPLLAGARVHIASDAELADPQAMLEQIKTVRPSVIQATPAYWRVLIDEGWTGDAELRAFCGGEALPPDLAATLATRCRELWNLYGPTETTVWSTCYRVEEGREIRIGTPIHNTLLRVVDESGRSLPVGVPGELLIGGLGVAQGYWRRDELTSKSFPEIAGDRWYRTGDRVRWRDDGNLEYLGRRDNQVKLRGFRIELAEIESALRELSQIKDCAVRVVDAGDDRRLAAYLLTASGEPASTVELRKTLRRSLPDCMIPQYFQFLDQLPMNASGKLDRGALPPPDELRTAEREALPLETPVERTIAGIWSELTGTAIIARGDNFFDLGGHSLLALKAVSAMEKALGYRISPQSLLTGTLEQLASRFEQEGAAAPKPPEPAGKDGLLRRVSKTLFVDGS